MSLGIDQFDLEAYLVDREPDEVKPDELVIECPSCGKRKLTVNTQKRTWHCWVCEEYGSSGLGRRRATRGAGGLLDLIQLLEGCPRERAIQIVQDQTGHRHVDTRQIYSKVLRDEPRFQFRELPPIPPPPGWRPIDSEWCYSHLPYLRQRGIFWSDVVDFGLFYCDSGWYAGRLIIPVWEQGRMVYWQARAMGESADPRFRKTLNPPTQIGIAHPTEVLMNLDRARHYRRVAIVEGPIDCIHAGPSSVATFGKKLSYVQAMKLRIAGVRRVDLMWDGPSEGEPNGAVPEMIQTAHRLAGIFDVRLVWLPRGDPGDYTRTDLDEFRAQAVPAAAVSRLARVGVMP